MIFWCVIKSLVEKSHCIAICLIWRTLFKQEDINTNWLQPIMKMPGHAGKNWIAVIHLADDKGTYQGQQGMTWEREIGLLLQSCICLSVWVLNTERCHTQTRICLLLAPLSMYAFPSLYKVSHVLFISYTQNVLCSILFSLRSFTLISILIFLRQCCEYLLLSNSWLPWAVEIGDSSPFISVNRQLDMAVWAYTS